MDKAGKTIEDFYRLQTAEKYEELLPFFHKKIKDKYGEDEILKLVEYKQELIGKQISYKQIKKSFKSRNSETYVGLFYECVGEKNTCYDAFFVQKVGDEYQILGYSFNLKQENLPKFEDNFK